MSSFRIGFGYDVHTFAEGRELWLGGVHFHHPVGLLGHSDADVLLHAICDALLGAAALGDIGRHFPNTEERWRGARSLTLLKESFAKVRQAGYSLGNIDCTVVAEEPKINPRIAEMREAICSALNCTPDQISIKATTNEGMDGVGRSEGIMAHAVALIVREA